MGIRIETMKSAPKDPDGDWAPAFNEACRLHLQELAQSSSPYRYQRTWVDMPIIVGTTRRHYTCYSPVHVFGAYILGIRDVTIRFPYSDGFIGHYPDTVGGTVPGTYKPEKPDLFDGFGGRLELSNVTVVGSPEPKAGTVGARIYWHHALFGCTFKGFDTGVQVSADVLRRSDKGGDAGASNANDGYLERVTCWDNNIGVRYKGGDSNAGLTCQLNASHNFVHGLQDSSFLGTTHLSPLCDHNGPGRIGGDPQGYDIICDSPSARTTIIGRYVENPGRIRSSGSVLFIGGIGGTFDSGAAVIEGPRLVNTEHRPEKPARGGGDKALHFCSEDAEEYTTYMAARWTSKDTLRTKRYTNGRFAGWWGVDVGNVYTGTSHVIAGPRAEVQGKPAVLGHMRFPYGYYCGDARVSVANKMPSSPEGYTIGSRVWNVAPEPGQPVGWVLTASLEWRPFGMVE